MRVPLWATVATTTGYRKLTSLCTIKGRSYKSSRTRTQGSDRHPCRIESSNKSWSWSKRSSISSSMSKQGSVRLKSMAVITSKRSAISSQRKTIALEAKRLVMKGKGWVWLLFSLIHCWRHRLFKIQFQELNPLKSVKKKSLCYQIDQWAHRIDCLYHSQLRLLKLLTFLSLIQAWAQRRMTIASLTAKMTRQEDSHAPSTLTYTDLTKSTKIKMIWLDERTSSFILLVTTTKDYQIRQWIVLWLRSKISIENASYLHRAKYLMKISLTQMIMFHRGWQRQTTSSVSQVCNIRRMILKVILA